MMLDRIYGRSILYFSNWTSRPLRSQVNKSIRIFYHSAVVSYYSILFIRKCRVVAIWKPSLPPSDSTNKSRKWKGKRVEPVKVEESTSIYHENGVLSLPDDDDGIAVSKVDIIYPFRDSVVFEGMVRLPSSEESPKIRCTIGLASGHCRSTARFSQRVIWLEVRRASLLFYSRQYRFKHYSWLGNPKHHVKMRIELRQSNVCPYGR